MLLLDSLLLESFFGSRVPRVIPRMASTEMIVTMRIAARRFLGDPDRGSFSSWVAVTKSEASSLSLFLDIVSMLFMVVI
jgi:hypothetical protein